MAVYLATLGQRPEAITIAFDRLKDRFEYHQVVILHTEPDHSGIADAYRRLKEIFERDYPGLPVHWYHLLRPDGGGLLDMNDELSVMDYYRAVYHALREYHRLGEPLHLMVAGGRKAMSIYAALAASLVFGKEDRVWSVLSPQEMLTEPGVFHIPSGKREQVHVVSLPFYSSRLALDSLPSKLVADPLNMLAEQSNKRDQFLRGLTEQERRIVELLNHHPDSTDRQLAVMLRKSPRTVSNQLNIIYRRLTSFLDYGEQIQHKRQALIDLLMER